MAGTETTLFHQTAAAKYGLGITDMETILPLLQEGSMAPGQLARCRNLTAGAVTNGIDGLEQQKITKRTSDANDRRKVIVTCLECRARTYGGILPFLCNLHAAQLY